MFTLLAAIVSHTPIGVWIGLAVLIALGLKQLRTRDIGATRVVLIPVVIGALSLWSATSAFAPAGEALILVAWAVGAGLGFASNRAMNLPRRVSANADGSFRVEGSIAPLLLFVGVFMVRYTCAVTLAIHPEFASQPLAASVGGIALGLPSGLLAARSRKIWSTRAGRADTLSAA